ncbi:hypothetical protein PRIC2_004049 [Phytophthora ramorum]
MGPRNKDRNALWVAPILYGLSTFFVCFMISLRPTATKNTHKAVMVGASAVCCIVVASITQVFLVPYTRNGMPSKTGRFLVEDDEDEGVDYGGELVLLETPDGNGDKPNTTRRRASEVSTSIDPEICCLLKWSDSPKQPASQIYWISVLLTAYTALNPTKKVFFREENRR